MEVVVNKIDIKRFNALAAQSRSPAAAFCSEELEWYADKEEAILGIVLRDTIDNDFSAILMCRDEGGRFRAFDVQASLATHEEATKWVIGGIKWQVGQGTKIYPQGDQSTGMDLFTPVVPPDKQHLYFSKLSKEDAFIPAKAIINELMPHFIDIDGNFVEQFQSTGFDSRLWELYLNTYLNEEQLFIEREHNAPDFVAKKYGAQVSIEAVIVGRKKENPISAFKTIPDFMHPSEIMEKNKDEMQTERGRSRTKQAILAVIDLTAIELKISVSLTLDFLSYQLSPNPFKA